MPQLNCFNCSNEQFPNCFNKVFEVATEIGFQLRGSFQKLRYSLSKTNTGQLAFFGSDFWNKTPEMLYRTNNINTFKHNLKQYFLNELKTSNNLRTSNFLFIYLIIFTFVERPQCKYTFWQACIALTWRKQKCYIYLCHYLKGHSFF